jgi:tRNA pseudouridine38-40 synthase
MLNLKITVQYDGTRYAGWQTQKGNKQKKGIQEILESTLQGILQEKIRLIGSGRTDAGVHAKAQIANFKTNSKIPPKNLQKALNTLLPKDIIISDIKEVPLYFHSRFAAKSKLYRYQILNRSYSDPFLEDYAYFYHQPLDVKFMRQEAQCLVGKHDFASFQASSKTKKRSIRTIKSLKITRRGDLICIEVKADGFLYNMVRSITGTLIEIGRNRFKKGDLKRILLAKDRKLAGPTVPSKGLFLIKVGY